MAVDGQYDLSGDGAFSYLCISPLGPARLVKVRTMEKWDFLKPFEPQYSVSLFSFTETMERLIDGFRQYQEENFKAYRDLCVELIDDVGELSPEQFNERIDHLFKVAKFHSFPLPADFFPAGSSDEEQTSKAAPSELARGIAECLAEYVGPEPPEILALAAYLYIFIEKSKRSRIIRSDILRNSNKDTSNNSASSRSAVDELYEKWSENRQVLVECEEGISEALHGGVDKWIVKLRSTSPGIWTSELGEEVIHVRKLLYDAPEGNEEAELAQLLESLEARFRTLYSLDFSAIQEAGQVKTPQVKKKGGNKKKARKPTINERMKAELASDLEKVKGYTAQQWATHLSCSKSSIIDSAVWGSLHLLRQQAKAEKRRDRSR